MIELGTQDYRRVTLSLALGSFIIFCNLYLFQPMLPYMAVHFSVSETQVNWLFAATTLALSFSLVPWAVASEATGRKRVMLAGLLTMPVIGLCMLLFPSLISLVAMRALMGIAIAAFASVAVAYMVEELSPKAFGQAIGGYIAANSLGGITGRIVGGTLTDALGWQQAVIVMAILTFIGALAVCVMLPKQKHFVPQKGMLRYHNRALIKHLKNQTIWLAMLIGGVNFALFVNLYSVMGFRLVAAPHSLPIGLASLIFLCYLPGTLSSKLTSVWNRNHQPISGMVCGTMISLLGMLVAYIDRIPFMILGLALISFGAFFTHTLAYAWVSQKATSAKATATALYLVHYYVGGSLGGFFLIYCWQHGGWAYVISGGMTLYLTIFTLCYKLNSISIEPVVKDNKTQTETSHELKATTPSQ
ncbi:MULTISPECIES: MFS transporter [Vibrio]|uniref:MFS transporter n=1 Tax=Vibrio TaxID=662 RepID=UPI002074D283|nr:MULTISPECIES: MFS transporter [Vibrio]USD33845.1 MFS transporter [Vibrio sp. SCSIO 43186]USD46945.1 MFS transporter [Vibrio sp. SCSIO 43145]USD70969.1 MFS transporter [Vibrio sp. SCSIO 43139]USD95875.1 MFS transporter [Vibrio coralliilyticus]